MKLLIRQLVQLMKKEYPLAESITDVPQGTEKVTNDYNNFLELADHRKTLAGPQLWCAGCSITYGLAVETDHCYSTILSKQLNLPLNLLASPGSSIVWAADQILRSDIKSNDIVVWGLTKNRRTPYIKDGKVSQLIVGSPADNKTGKLLQKILKDDDLTRYHNLTKIHQVINFCEKIGAKLLIVGLLSSPKDFLYLKQVKHYYHYYYSCSDFKDKGIDNIHPGPLQHQEYAEKIMIILRTRGYI